MNLSFLSEMQVTLSEYITGKQRFQNINKMIMFNSAWKEEAFECLRDLMIHMREIKASDIDIGGPGSKNKIWFRVYGIKKPSNDLPIFKQDEITAILLSILTDDQKVILFNNKNVDISLGLVLKKGERPNRFRGDIYYESNTLAANFRRVNQEIFSMEHLNFSEIIEKRFNLNFEKSGLFLITGITGSGKSSTLDSIVDMNNKTNHAHIVIIGNPIEYIHQSIKSIVRHREVGEDVLTFQEGTIQALRQDPDIIVVGEMRDPGTIATVLEATDSGHKVFSTLHTSSAIDSLHRIVAEFPPIEQERVRYRLADTLKVIVSQKLVPDKFGKLVMIKEVLSVNSSVQAAIKNNNIGEIYQMITEGKKSGMLTLEQDLFTFYKKGIIMKEVAMNYANNKKRINQLLAYSA